MATKQKSSSKQMIDITWDDLSQYAETRIINRGVSYQRNGYVSELMTTERGTIVAWVNGSKKYAVEMGMKDGELVGECNCPYWDFCKHQVAVVLEYLEVVKKGKKIPLAKKDDIRGSLLETDPDAAFDSSSGDPMTDLDLPGIKSQLLSKSKGDLIDMIMDLVERFPEIGQELTPKRQWTKSEVNTVIKRLKAEIVSVASEPGWSRHWSDESYIPDYSNVRQKMGELLDRGYNDELLDLGRLLLQEGTNQMEMTDDDGETGEEIGECINLAFVALEESSLPPLDKMKWALEMEQEDEYDLCDGLDMFWDLEFEPENWSRFADFINSKMEKWSKAGDNDYRRRRMGDWLTTALEMAGREDDTLEIMEREAIQNHRYERLVTFLMEKKDYEAARKWIKQGIEATSKTYPGIADLLRVKMVEILGRTKDQKGITVIIAEAFFDSPSTQAYKRLKESAQKIKLWSTIYEGIYHYLEKGELPKSWPLVASGLGAIGRFQERRFPAINRLIELHILEERPEQVFRWYQEWKKTNPHRPPDGQAHDIARAIKDIYPDESIHIWKSIAENLIELVNASAYDRSIPYIRNIKDLLIGLNRTDEWLSYYDLLKKHNSRRPRCMEALRTLDSAPIIKG